MICNWTSNRRGLYQLLDAAAERYGEDPYIAESVSELKLKLSEPEEREELQRQQVARWREEAKKGDAILRHSRLQQALGLARTYGLTEVVEEILLEMQAITPADLDLKPITAEVEIPREEVDVYVRSYAEDSGSWQEALLRFGSEGPPSGDAQENAKLTKELAEKYPIQRIFTTQVMGPHGSITAVAGSEKEHDRIELARHESMRIGIWAPIGVEILDVVKDAFDVPDRDRRRSSSPPSSSTARLRRESPMGCCVFSTVTTTAHFTSSFRSWRPRFAQPQPASASW